MNEEKLEYTKMRERIVWAIKEIKSIAKAEGIEFDKKLLLSGIETGRCLFVRSEISYSGNRG